MNIKLEDKDQIVHFTPCGNFVPGVKWKPHRSTLNLFSQKAGRQWEAQMYLAHSYLYSLLKGTLIGGERDVISLDFTIAFVTLWLSPKRKKKKTENFHLLEYVQLLQKNRVCTLHIRKHTFYIVLGTSLFSLPENNDVQYRPQVFTHINTDSTDIPEKPSNLLNMLLIQAPQIPKAGISYTSLSNLLTEVHPAPLCVQTTNNLSFLVICYHDIN